MKKFTGLLILIIGYFFIAPGLLKPVLAVKYSLVAPAGQLKRGDNVKFTVNIDTQGASVKTGSIGMTYETQYLQYVSTTPGNAMTTVSTSQVETNKLLLSGENGSGFTGSGVFAYVEFKIIAAAPGSTQLCVLWAPTATPQPTSPPQATAAPTSPPAVTNLPTSGETTKTSMAASIGIGFVVVFAVFYFLNRQIVFKKRPKP